MVYVAFLRGINVGGNTKVEMSTLKQTFEKVGFSSVKTYINSGNVIFTSEKRPIDELVRTVEQAVAEDFKMNVPVLIRNITSINSIVKAVPTDWTNDKNMKCDVLLLWPEVDSKEILNTLSINPENEDVLYVPGALIWRIDRKNQARGNGLKLIGTETYKKMTARNINTIRKILSLMEAV